MVKKCAIPLFCCLLLAGITLNAKIFFDLKAIQKKFFPQADNFERKTYYLNKKQINEINSKLSSKQQIKSGMLVVYVAKKQASRLGYLILDTHKVRTLDETIAVAISSNLQIQNVETLKFLEPLDYLAPDRWLKQFLGKDNRSRLQINQDIQGISGATLTAHAVNDSLKRLLLMAEKALR